MTTITPTALDAATARVEELRQAVRQREQELAEFYDRIGDRTATRGESERLDNLSRAVQNARTAHDEAKSAWRSAMADAVASGTITRESGDGAKSFNVNRGALAEPWDYQRDMGEATYTRDRALAAVERAAEVPDEGRQLATELVEQANLKSDPAGLSYRWAIASGSPAYLSAFRKFMRDPEAAHFTFDAAERAAFSEVRDLSRAMGEGSVGAGGAMVPQALDPAIILTNNGNDNSFRQVSKVVRIATKTWEGVSSAGVTAEWLAESTEVADASPTLSQPSITPVRADAHIQASFELADDTAISSEISGLIADARSNLEATAFATGTGSTQPYGIVTALQLVTASRVAGSSGAAGAADFVLADVYAVDDALPARAQANASWHAAKAIHNKIRRFGEGSTANSAFWADLGQGVPPQLLGHPAYVASGMDTTVVSGSNDDVLVLGDFRHFVIVDNVASHMVYNPLVLGSNRRPVGEVSWTYFWRVGSDCVNPAMFRMLRL
ncbi:MAG: phage major capsid protein [Actinomycetota bacterium]